jgi:hypothetical protein
MATTILTGVTTMRRRITILSSKAIMTSPSAATETTTEK